MDSFLPVLRFIVTSDIHYEDSHPERKLRFERGMELALSYAESQPYSGVDAFFAVGDFTGSGKLSEYESFKSSLDKCLPEGIERYLSVASHEFMNAGVETAYERLEAVFSQRTDNHAVIKGFHFISVSVEKGNSLGDEKQAWIRSQLKLAADEGHKKPIFFFQHPHLTDTVYGSINWGDNDIIPILMDYPQVIDFSGHSHAPVNDPRSVHQKYFTSFGTGSFAYFELDEFDKYYGTVPPDSRSCAQFLIVEVDGEGRVRVLPYDVLSESFFPNVSEIETPWEPESFTYTHKRRDLAKKPYFEDGAKLTVTENEKGVTLEFPQAKADSEYVNDYLITVRRKEGTVAKQLSLWSSYYLQPMPTERSVTIADLPQGEYTVRVTARGFWDNESENCLTARFSV